MLIVCGVRSYQVQDYRNDNKKFSVASKLLAVVHLLPPSQSVVHTLVIGKWGSLLPVEEVVCNREVAEVDEGPGHAGGAAEDGEDEEPGDEEDEDVGGPDPRVHEPLGVLVQIRRRHRLHVQLRHRSPRLALPARACCGAVAPSVRLGVAGAVACALLRAERPESIAAIWEGPGLVWSGLLPGKVG